MREDQEGICDTHQSANKIKWFIQCASFYWSAMLNDCFRYYSYKDCLPCQKVKEVQFVPAFMLRPIIK
jgi:hypothetical protein